MNCRLQLKNMDNCAKPTAANKIHRQPDCTTATTSKSLLRCMCEFAVNEQFHTFLQYHSSRVSFQWSPAALSKTPLTMPAGPLFKERHSGISVRCTLSNVYFNRTAD